MQCLEMQGFHQSELDTCFFTHPYMIYLSFLDDSDLIGHDRAKIEAMITDLSTELDLTCEGGLMALNGIPISKSPLNGSMTISQEGLFTCVLETIGLLCSHCAATPSNKEALDTASNCPPAQKHWDNCSVVSMLMCLASNFCPVIAFVVHQCECFLHCPILSDEGTVKDFCKYHCYSNNT